MNVALIVATTLNNAIERIGAYGGLASTIGLGVLALLYFAQAREVKRLREWAGRAPERAAEIEQRVQTDAQRRVIAQPQTPAAAAQVASPPASLPSPTAGLTGEAATRAAAAAIVAARATHPPAVGPPGQLARPAVPPAGTPGSPAPAPNPAAAAVPKPAVPPGTVPAPPAAPAGGAASPAPPMTGPGAAPKLPPAPSNLPAAAPTKLPAAPSAAPAMAAKPPTATAGSPPAPSGAAQAKPRVVAQPSAGANGNIGQETRESAAARPAPPLPPPPDRPPPADSRPADDGDRRTSLHLAAIIGGAVGCVLIVGLIVMFVGGDDPAPKSPNELGTVAEPSATAPADSADSTRPAAVNRGATATTVLNGTVQAGLARTVATKLGDAGFKIEEVKDNVDQTLPETIVYYSDGNRRAAGVVARIIGVPQRAIQPVDRNVEVAASGARVVVTVGADLIE